jgi:RNA polymerase sigma factor (sigma-70 family)
VEGRPLEDAELIGRAKDGDVGAYEELVRRYQGIAVRVAYLASRGADDAADAAQEAFVKAYRALPRFREGAPFRPWLLRIVANEASNRRRAAGRRERLAARLMEVEGHGAGASQRRVLLDAVNGLRDEDRLALGYRFFLGFSDAETAAALGIPLGTVKSRVSRALRRLRMLLPPDDRDPAETVGHVREHRPGGGVGG